MVSARMFVARVTAGSFPIATTSEGVVGWDITEYTVTTFATDDPPNGHCGK